MNFNIRYSLPQDDSQEIKANTENIWKVLEEIIENLWYDITIERDNMGRNINDIIAEEKRKYGNNTTFFTSWQQPNFEMRV